MNKTMIIAGSIALCLLTGFIASILQGDSLENWYPLLNKSSLNPPDWVFPVVWTILYLFMGLSLALVLLSSSRQKRPLAVLFIAQLALNFLWSVVFFTLKSPAAALVIIALLEILILVYIQRSRPVSRAASLLFIPYAVWVAFAAYLNLYIVLNN